jgi:hypothetical protein
MNGPPSEREFEARWPWVVAFAAFAVLLRVAPRLLLSPETNYVWNLMPVGALGLFVGVRLRSPVAYLVPPAAMLAADLLLWKPLADRGLPAFSLLTPIIYLSFALNVLIGRLLRPTSSPAWVIPLAVLTSLQFFLTSNFAVWALGHGQTYPHTLSGLLLCFEMALPFYQNTLAGDLLYSAVFFGLHTAAVLVTQRQKASQPA